MTAQVARRHGLIVQDHPQRTMRTGSQYGSETTTMSLFSVNYDLRNASSVKPEAQLVARDP
ncbi:uncharacterized protein EAE98_000380 [Botrytis deweyae]|uniref:Uncharacterized protein n=1 Tax=Botrytis deweyae TaxID=2478750 RepID=A0ABQ7J2S9_9HELO|nr:uncharacterized protein EAE98_000380 [Botrytis deweyae]KAF7940253.1 hypothetical protein EAE98_000380 [Botrytis deweyae]